LNKQIPVCKQAFISLHGVTYVDLGGCKSPLGKRWIHDNRPTAVPAENENVIEVYIKDFKPRHSQEEPLILFPLRNTNCESNAQTFEEYHIQVP
jgi:hypothetical protein